jgi:cation diffusion facilitator family transporter
VGSSILTPHSVTWASIAINLSMAISKVVGGLVFGSQALLADALHTGSDMVTDVAVLAGLAISNRPADRGHPYGHHRVSTLVAVFVGAILVGGAALVGYKAIITLPGREENVAPLIPFLLAALTVPLKEVLYRVTRHVGLRVRDMSLLANAWHHRSDAFTSVAAAAGLAGVMIGGPGWQALDAMTALVLAAFLLVVGAKILRSAISELADAAPAAQTLERIGRAVKDTQGVLAFHAFRARQVGGKVEMDVHVEVAPTLTVAQGHAIASAVEDAVTRADSSVVGVVVHVEPAGYRRR